MPNSRIAAPQCLHSISSDVSTMIGAGVTGVLPASARGSVQQEVFEAFGELVAAGQMSPGSLEIEELPLSCGIVRFEGAPFAVRCMFKTLRDVGRCFWSMGFPRLK
jgi:hypothetical protein